MYIRTCSVLSISISRSRATYRVYGHIRNFVFTADASHPRGSMQIVRQDSVSRPFLCINWDSSRELTPSSSRSRDLRTRSSIMLARPLSTFISFSLSLSLFSPPFFSVRKLRTKIPSFIHARACLPFSFHQHFFHSGLFVRSRLITRCRHGTNSRSGEYRFHQGRQSEQRNKTNDALNLLNVSNENWNSHGSDFDSSVRVHYYATFT